MTKATKAKVEEKYGISKWNGIMLLIQMVLVVCGLINACLSVYDGVMSGLGFIPVIVAIIDVMAFVAVIHYSVMGFRRQDDLAFIGVIYVFTAALLFKQIAVFDGVAIKIIVGVAFGISFLFSQRLKDQRFAKGCMNTVCLLLFIAGVILTVQLYTGEAKREDVVPEDEMIQMTPEQIASMTSEQLKELQEMIKTQKNESVETTETSVTTMRLTGEEEETGDKGFLDRFVDTKVGKNGELSTFRKFIVLCAYWSPLLLAGTIALTYHTRMQRVARKNAAKGHADHAERGGHLEHNRQERS